MTILKFNHHKQEKTVIINVIGNEGSRAVVPIPERGANKRPLKRALLGYQEDPTGLLGHSMV